MKSLFVLLVSIFMFNTGFGQAQPVKWSFKISPKTDIERTITATATIDEGWSLYSQHTDDEGPVPTTFSFDGVDVKGDTEEISKAITEYSELFELEVVKFENKAIFTQKFVPDTGSKTVTARVNFMCCDGEKCLPPSDIIYELAL